MNTYNPYLSYQMGLLYYKVSNLMSVLFTAWVFPELLDCIIYN